MLSAKLVLSSARGVEEADTPPISRVEAEHEALKAVATIEKTLIPAAVSAVGVAGATAAHDAVLSAAAPIAVALAKEDQLKEAVKKAKEAAERIYEAARELWKAAKVTLQRIYEIVVEAIARALDYVKAHWFIFAAAAAGLIAYSLAQQLDFQLWMEHVAKFAFDIAGVPAFKKLKTLLENVEPALLEAADAALRSLSDVAVEKLFEEANKAVVQSSKTWHEFRRVIENVEKHGGRTVKPAHAAVAWALLEAGVRKLGDVMDKLATLREKAERLTRGEAVEVLVKDYAEYVWRIRDVTHKLRLVLDYIVKYAEELEKAAEKLAGGDRQRAKAIKKEVAAIRRTFAVTKLAEELAEATTAKFGKLGGATLADKVVAFFESLAYGTIWSRVVLNAMAREETYRALVITPSYAHVTYLGGEKAEDDVGAWGVLLERTVYTLAEMGYKKMTIKPEKNVANLLIDDKEVAAVKISPTVSGIRLQARGPLADEEGLKAMELVKKVKKGKAETYQLLALLMTDGGYIVNEKEKTVIANTSSILQAAWYRHLGFEVRYARRGNLTEDGLKPEFKARLSTTRGGREAIEMVKSALATSVEILRGDPALKEELQQKVREIFERVEFSDNEKAKAEVWERIKKFLNELRLGKDGAVCLYEAEGCKHTLTYKHEPYARSIAPLLYYITVNAPREEVKRFLANAILYDGHVDRREVYLAMGNFKSRKEKLPLDVYDKLALFIIFAAKYGVAVERLKIEKSEVKIYFKRKYATEMFMSAGSELSLLWRLGREWGIGDKDHVFKKIRNIMEYVEEYAGKITIEHTLYAVPGVDPWVVVRFKDNAGREVAHIFIRWHKGSLRAYFSGTRDEAERLSMILNALGAEAEVRRGRELWYVVIYTGSIAAIRRPEWLDAVRDLIDALYASSRIGEEQRNRLLAEINKGPNVVEVAGIEMNVLFRDRAPRQIEVFYQPRSVDSFEAAIKALEEAGFIEGVHFTAQKPKDGEQGYVYLKMPTGLWKLEELKRAGVKWAKNALDRLEEMAKARGFYDLLDRLLRPAREAETIDPSTVVVADKERGIRIVVKNITMKWVIEKRGQEVVKRPRVQVEYEVNGKVRSFYFTWGIKKDRTCKADVKLDDEKAAVLATLTGDDSIKGKNRTVLYAKHLFALARYKGVGWELLRWYAETIRSDLTAMH